MANAAMAPEEEEDIRTSVRFDTEDDVNESNTPPPPSPPPSTAGSGTSSNVLKHSSSFNSPNLRSNLTREQTDRDPLFYYEVVKTLGVGSMGSVARVKKRTNVVGGSARKDIQDAVRRHRRNKKCLQIPFIGGLFRFCLDGEMTYKKGEGEKSMRSVGSNGAITDLLESSNGSVSSASVQSTPSTSEGTPSILHAMKSIHLNRVTDDAFLTELRNEIDILKKLDHPHIVRALETYEHRNQIFIVMELCSGGDLYSRDPYTEEEAARIASSILSAIAYMHSKNILHRDLKYENILFVNDSPQAEIKLIDFGLSKVYGDNPQLTEGVGTIYTMAPEVLKGNYTTKADVWSVGVIAYMLLSSQMPFYGRKRRHIVEQILNCQYDFRGRRWKRTSDQAKAFVEELLILDPEERLDAQTAMSLTWLNRRFAATTRGPDEQEENMARHAMLRYAGYTKLKKMALMVVAHKSNSSEIGILRKVFKKYDKSSDGSIGYEDFCTALAEFGHDDDGLRDMFEAVDLDGTGRIRYTEFLAATIEARGAISEERLAEAFDRLDTDDSGFISADNLVELLGAGFPREEIDEIISEADLTHDNQISYAEFLALWDQKREVEREEELRMLGEDPDRKDSTEFDMNSFRGSSMDLYSMQDLEAETVEARADFLHEKHDHGKKVGFTGSVVEISTDNTLQEKLMLDH